MGTMVFSQTQTENVKYVFKDSVTVEKGINLPYITEKSISGDSIRIPILDEDNRIHGWVNKDSIGGTTLPDGDYGDVVINEGLWSLKPEAGSPLFSSIVFDNYIDYEHLDEGISESLSLANSAIQPNNPSNGHVLIADGTYFNSRPLLKSDISDLGSYIETSDLIDDDTMATASSTTVPTSESVKAYVDNNLANKLSTTGTAADSDKVDGIHANQFLRNDASSTKTAGTTTFNDGIEVRFGTDSDMRFVHDSGINYMRLNSGDFIIRDIANNVDRFTFSRVTGDLDITGAISADDYLEGSDERYKSNIQDLVTEPMEVRWKSYEMNGKQKVGVIAQELELAHPEFVHTDKNGFKSVAYLRLLICKVAELEDRVKKLEQSMANLLANQN